MDEWNKHEIIVPDGPETRWRGLISVVKTEKEAP